MSALRCRRQSLFHVPLVYWRIPAENCGVISSTITTTTTSRIAAALNPPVERSVPAAHVGDRLPAWGNVVRGSANLTRRFVGVLRPDRHAAQSTLCASWGDILNRTLVFLVTKAPKSEAVLQREQRFTGPPITPAHPLIDLTAFGNRRPRISSFRPWKYAPQADLQAH